MYVYADYSSVCEVNSTLVDVANLDVLSIRTFDMIRNAKFIIL